MLNGFIRRAAPLACAWLLGVLAAQAAGAAPPEPELAAPFDRYRGWRDEPLLDWRAANARVGQIGGWRTYLRESQPAGDDTDRGGQGDHGYHAQ
jgi:hypothetical protein